jgi:DNA (cytosine-5)-methyltransferase 1
MCGLGPVIWQCDSDPYARAVLEAHWPGVKRYDDVRSIDAKTERPTIICGGFPCQPVSVAGKRKAQRDTRWLWPHFASAIAAVRPAVVFIENVPGLRGAGLRDVLADLASLGFDAEWGDFSAEAVGAPHRRRRLFLVAHAQRVSLQQQPRRRERARGAGALEPRQDGQPGEVADTDGARLEALGRSEEPSHAEPAELGGPWPPEPNVGRVAHGVPARTHRLRLLGNACVPAQAALAWRTLTARLGQPITTP